ncbi:hypothetical protein ONZ43_g2374 [Nemania bipapillata]|uniref:Uncharacterized protein n=1 Tax=Nemania bipapillata TaxID=110536 RepID=A0ACC2J0W7_9PEZI|nr:hypothetical protein ONZ43_g2374 [Nemania bipapillata]
MACNTQTSKETCVEGLPKTSPASDAEKLYEDDTSTLSSNDHEIDSKIPVMDERTPLWKNLQVNGHNASPVLESWEIIYVRPTRELTSQKCILVPSYSQADLALEVDNAQRDFAVSQSGIGCFKKQETYGQNLARRIFELPASLPSKLGALLDCRFVATNKNPCVRREWKIVMLTPITGALTDEGPRTNSRGLWRKGDKGQNQPVQKWLAIIRGQETRFNEKGFAAFGTGSNPWIKIDERGR